MCHAACEVEFQPFNRSYSQRTFFIFYKTLVIRLRIGKIIDRRKQGKVDAARFAITGRADEEPTSTLENDPARKRYTYLYRRTRPRAFHGSDQFSRVG